MTDLNLRRAEALGRLRDALREANDVAKGLAVALAYRSAPEARAVIEAQVEVAFLALRRALVAYDAASGGRRQWWTAPRSVADAPAHLREGRRGVARCGAALSPNACYDVEGRPPCLACLKAEAADSVEAPPSKAARDRLFANRRFVDHGCALSSCICDGAVCPPGVTACGGCVHHGPPHPPSLVPVPPEAH